MATQGSILLVDDDAVNRQVLGWLFRDAGYAVREAGSRADALALAADRPDLVVLDVNLPDMSGFDVCRRLRDDPALRSVGIIHLSAVHVKPGDRSQGLEQGADAYLVKPADPRELMATAKALLRVRMAEEAARKAAQEWRSTFDAISDGVCLLDADDRICRCNRALCELLGRDFDSLLRQPLGMALAESLAGWPEAAPLSWLAGVPRPAPGGERLAEEVLLGERWLRVSADPFLGTDGAAAGSVVTLSDITRRKELEEQLRQAHRLEAIGRLAGGIAHDFNNLLQVILGNASMLLEGMRPGSAEHGLASTVERSAWRAAELTRQLLGFSRRTLLWLQPVDPSEAVRLAAADAAEGIPPTVRFDVQAGEGLWKVLADPGQLRQSLARLCQHAGAALPRGSRLVLSASNATLLATEAGAEGRAGEFVRFRVQDDGPGMPPELAETVFDPFNPSKALGQGDGLGLAFVHGIAKQHQGWVECRSAPGQGTRFDLWLPRTTAAAPVPGPTTAAPAGGARRVLVA
ncbi:MAG: response regulator, partial [Gemmataceae bacterium]|nr:response regulator [Gemmataceae bacterium]